jgi:hypothetical protein
MSVASSIRGFFDDLFYSKLVSRLEEDLLRVRQDFESRIQDYKEIIADLRAEKAMLTGKISMYELNINRRVGIDPTAKRPEKPSFASFTSPPMETSWQAEVRAHDEQIEKELAEEKTEKK